LDLAGQLIGFLNYDYKELNTFTGAGIIGTLQKKGKGWIPKYGALYDADYLRVDEAKNLVTANQWTYDLKTTLNGFLDKRHISKKMANGWIEYDGKAVIVTGTFVYGDLKLSIIEDGFLQRFMFVYKYFKQDDVRRIDRKIDSLANIDYKYNIKPIFEKIGEILMKDVNQKQYKLYPTSNKFCIKIPKNISEDFGGKVSDFYSEKLKDVFDNKRLQSNLDTFLTRSKKLGRKIMTHYSVLNNE